jgi:hypothetical protein
VDGSDEPSGRRVVPPHEVAGVVGGPDRAVAGTDVLRRPVVERTGDLPSRVDTEDPAGDPDRVRGRGELTNVQRPVPTGRELDSLRVRWEGRCRRERDSHRFRQLGQASLDAEVPLTRVVISKPGDAWGADPETDDLACQVRRDRPRRALLFRRRGRRRRTREDGRDPGSSEQRNDQLLQRFKGQHAISFQAVSVRCAGTGPACAGACARPGRRSRAGRAGWAAGRARAPTARRCRAGAPARRLATRSARPGSEPGSVRS